MSNIDREKKEEVFSPDQLVFVTNTLYKDWYSGSPKQESDTAKVRGDITLKSIKTSVENGHPIVIADGGSSQEFIVNAKKLGATIVNSSLTPGRAPQRRAAFKEGASLEKVKALFYIQAEKVGVVDNSMRLSLPILQGSADIVVPSRESLLFKKSYPDYMYRSEIKVNKTYNDIMHKLGWLDENTNLDWFFGPVVFKKDLLPLFMEKYEFIDTEKRTGVRAKVNPEMHSDGHYFPIIKALSLGLKVHGVEIPFAYPKEQLNNETSSEAKIQFIQRRGQDAFTYRDEMIHFVKYLCGDLKKSKIRGLK